jgi:hypothetical protein
VPPETMAQQADSGFENAQSEIHTDPKTDQCHERHTGLETGATQAADCRGSSHWGGDGRGGAA